jgi:hypothetical protein
MAPLKQKGDLAELAVALDLRRRGYRIAFPYGEDSDYDLVVDRHGRLERVQVKHTRSDGCVVVVRCRSVSVTNGKVMTVKQYTAAMIEWLAVYDVTTERCYYVPAAMLGEGRSLINLRLVPARSGRKKGVHMAVDFLEL